MSISDEIRAKRNEVLAEINKRKGKSMEKVDAEIRFLQQNPDDHLNGRIKDALLQTLSGLYKIAPAPERLVVYQNFINGNYHRVIEDLEKYSKLVKDSNESARVQELANMVGMLKIDGPEYFSRKLPLLSD